jgi:hypothetical protein
MRSFANSSLLLSLSLVALLTPKCSVQAHFLFAKLDASEQGVKVYFSEPAAMEGKAIQYVGNRVNKLTMIGPSFKSNGDTQSIDLKIDTDDAGYLSGALPTEKKLDNTPYFITGFLDYGDFGEGDGPKKDLQYTYSIQMSSTNPSDDFSHFFHYVAGTDAVSPYRDFFTDGDDSNTEDPFAIALNNYGPPYRVVMRGVGESTPVRVCVYEGNGSNRKVGCVEGTHNRTHHLTFDAEVFGVLNPCETYYALGNTTEIDEVTGKVKTLWSSTSIIWNGPCRTEGVEPRAPVPQWYESTHFGDHHSSTTETTSTSPIMDPSVTKSLLFTGGFLAGIFLYHIMMRYAKCCQKQNNGAHFNVVSTDEKTECYSDDDISSTQQMT